MISFKEIKENTKKYLKLCKCIYTDKRTPKSAKILLWITIAYAVSPIDLIPDFIPVIGYLDDLIILPSLFYSAIKLVPKSVFTEHYKKIFQKKVF